MRKNILSDPIKQNDIEDYLKGYADFSFELKVLKQLTDLGLDCEHSGTYDDPITGKSREFDIRASYVLGKYQLSIQLSVECKNIQASFPLILHCLRRNYHEAYNELIYTFDPDRNSEDNSEDEQIGFSNLRIKTHPLDTLMRDKSRAITVQDKDSLYLVGEFVAKSADQVGRLKSDNTITATDSDVFEKISQAINSATDLISYSHYEDTETDDYITLVCPVLVVPDSVLWQVNYSNDGSIEGSPKLTHHISYYFGKQWTVGDNLSKLTYTLSHLEIITISELDSFINNYLANYIKNIEKNIERIIDDSEI